MGMMGKAVLIAVWVTTGQPPVVQQVDVLDLDRCLTLKAEMERAEKSQGQKGFPHFTAYCSPR